MQLGLIALLSAVAGTWASILRFEPAMSETKAQGITKDWPPKFCNGLDCPHFTVINSTKEYEIRQYDASNWVTTELAGIDYDEATYTMFMRLFDYISGKNAKKEKIAMTAPVLVSIIPGQGPACENNFTMSFYMSPKVSDPPAPTDKTVRLDSMKAGKIYTRSFGGFASQKDWIKEAKELTDALPKTAKYRSDFFLTAGYNSPFQILNRHNEVWFLSEYSP